MVKGTKRVVRDSKIRCRKANWATKCVFFFYLCGNADIYTCKLFVFG